MSSVSEKTHNKIMTAAENLVLEHGRSSITMSDVIRGAEVSKATIYRDSRFLEWWRKSGESNERRTCSECEKNQSLERQLKECKSTIRDLEKSLAQTTSALAALHMQLQTAQRQRNNVSYLGYGAPDDKP